MAALGQPDRPPARTAAGVEHSGSRRQPLRKGAPVQLPLDATVERRRQPVPLRLAPGLVVLPHSVEALGHAARVAAQLSRRRLGRRPRAAPPPSRRGDQQWRLDGAGGNVLTQPLAERAYRGIRAEDVGVPGDPSAERMETNTSGPERQRADICRSSGQGPQRTWLHGGRGIRLMYPPPRDLRSTGARERLVPEQHLRVMPGGSCPPSTPQPPPLAPAQLDTLGRGEPPAAVACSPRRPGAARPGPAGARARAARRAPRRAAPGDGARLLAAGGSGWARPARIGRESSAPCSAVRTDRRAPRPGASPARP